MSLVTGITLMVFRGIEEWRVPLRGEADGASTWIDADRGKCLIDTEEISHEKTHLSRTLFNGHAV